MFQASAEYVSAEILVAEPLTNRLDIVAYNVTVDSNLQYGAVDERSLFEVKLTDGSDISTTTSGRTEFLSYEWNIYLDGNLVYTNSSGLNFWF